MLKVLFLVALIGLAVYLVVRATQRGTGPQQQQRRRSPGQRPHPRRPIAPDDDLDFLRDLDRKRKHPDDPDAI